MVYFTSGCAVQLYCKDGENDFSTAKMLNIVILDIKVLGVAIYSQVVMSQTRVGGGDSCIYLTIASVDVIAYDQSLCSS